MLGFLIYAFCLSILDCISFSSWKSYLLHFREFILDFDHLILSLLVNEVKQLSKL